MNKKTILAISAVFIGILAYSVLNLTGVKDDKLYTVKEEKPAKDIAKIDSEIKVNGKNNFYDISDFLSKLDKSSILVTVSKNKESIYYMTPSTSKTSVEKVTLKGRTNVNMNLFRLDLSTEKVTEVAANIPFITSISWSPDGAFAAFRGESFILLYNGKNNTSVMQDVLSKEQIEHTSWSGDGKKLYLEYLTIPNGGVIYTDSLKLAQSYEIKEEAFFKESLDEETFFGVKQNLNTTTALLSTCNTIIMDDRGEKLLDVGPGIYRDSFNKSVLLKNLNNTYSFIRDFSVSQNPAKLTNEVVYDGGFLYDGGLYYITHMENSLNNEFILHRLDNTGKEINRLKISGSSLLLLPDGKRGYVNGPGLEILDFEKNSVTPRSDTGFAGDIISSLSSTLLDIKESLISGESLRTSGHFTASASSAANELLDKVNGSVSETFRDLYISLNPEERVVLNNLKITSASKAEAEVQITVRTYWIKEFNATYKLKLIKENDLWKISELN